ncbi:sensor histidine kinase [Lacisediminihabitans sp. FW035]
MGPLSRMLRRYLAAGLAIAVLSAFGAIWLATTSTISYNQPQAEANSVKDQEIYGALIRWAGRHRSWDGIDRYLESIANVKQRRVALIAGNGTVVLDTRPDLPLPSGESSRIDPLQLVAVPPGDGNLTIDPRVTGAFELDVKDRARMGSFAAKVVDCLGEDNATSAVWETGRITVSARSDLADCGRAALNTPLPAEQAALDQLSGLVSACRVARDEPAAATVAFALDDLENLPRELTIRVTVDESSPSAEQCLLRARLDQAAMWTAPALDLFITDYRGDQRGLLDLSPGSRARIAVVAAAILLMVLLASTIIVLPTLRGMRALTAAVDRFAGGDRTDRLGVTGRDEFKHLNDAFNRMSDQIAGHEDARRRLLSDIAHELRSPLTNIRGWLEAADDGMEVSEAELRGILLKEALRLQRITTDLQLLTNAEAGELPIHLEPVDLASLVKDVVAGHRPGAFGPALNVAVLGPIVVETDPDRLRQVLDNLIVNAVRHTPPGGSVQITAERGRDDVRLVVADTGSGISQADLPHIFDRFWRGDPSRMREGESTGLGLSIVRALVDVLDGRITVRSDQSGTVFTVTLDRGRESVGD